MGNNTVIVGAQYVEKALKGLLEMYSIRDEDLLRTHSVRKLVRELSKHIKVSKNILDIHGYDFDVRYPVDGYFDVTVEDVELMEMAWNNREVI